MADVFISYAREARSDAESLAEILVRHGWNVWWDRELVVGDEFDDVIRHEITAASCVIVLWSTDSVASRYVRGEARLASRLGLLLPAQLERCDIPLDLESKHTADLSSWDGAPSHPGVLDLVRAIEQRVGAGVAGRSGSARTPEPTASKIYISFLREESALGWPGRLYVRLGDDFGEENVSFAPDVQPGEWRGTIQSAVESCNVFVAVIGPEWTELVSAGVGRGDSETDQLVFEVMVALQSGISILPILVEGAAPLSTSALPAEIAGLARHIPFALRSDEWTRYPSQISDQIRGLRRG